jgi:hypothetical protein
MDGIIGTGGFRNDHKVGRSAEGRALRWNEHKEIRVYEMYAPFLHEPFSEPVYLAAMRSNKGK